MAFGLPKTKKQPENSENHNTSDNDTMNDDVFPVSSHKNKEVIGFLQPTKDAKKDSMNDPYTAELTQKSAYQYTLKTLNALKIVSPIMSALMQRPGVDAPNEDMTDSFRRLITDTSNISQQVCEKLGIDSTKERNFWIRNVLEKSFAEILHNQWIADGKTNLENIEKLIDGVIEFGGGVAEKGQYDEVSEESLVKLAGIKAMLPVLNEANNFNLYRNLENDIEIIMTKLFETATQAVEKLADPYANETERSKLFYMIMQEAGELYAASWRCEGNRVEKIMNTHPKEKLKTWVEKYQSTGGFPLDKIDHDFDKYFNKMIIITEKLVLAQKGSMDKRLKIKS
jgi:hypothetical protein